MKPIPESIIAQLKAYSVVAIKYDGRDGEGDIRVAYFTPDCGFGVPTKLASALQKYVLEFLEDQFYNWKSGDGSFGVIEFNADTLTLNSEHHIRVIETDDYEQSWKFDGTYHDEDDDYDDDDDYDSSWDDDDEEDDDYCSECYTLDWKHQPSCSKNPKNVATAGGSLHLAGLTALLTNTVPVETPAITVKPKSKKKITIDEALMSPNGKPIKLPKKKSVAKKATKKKTAKK